jgi:F0F1-type ATP synthase gamma subunit
MKMVSAAKLKKAQDAITAMRPMPKINWTITKPSATLKEMWESIQHNVK